MINDEKTDIVDDLNDFKLTLNDSFLNGHKAGEIITYQEISSHRKIIGKIIVFLKKIIRKSIKWYVEPICKQQTKFNKEVISNINEINKKIVIIQEKLHNENHTNC